jgi:hypothetical protein
MRIYKNIKKHVVCYEGSLLACNFIYQNKNYEKLIEKERKKPEFISLGGTKGISKNHIKLLTKKSEKKLIKQNPKQNDCFGYCN